MDTNKLATFAGGCRAYRNCGPGVHEIKLVVTKIVGTIKFYFDFAAGSDDFDIPGIAISNVIRMSAAKCIERNTSDANVDMYNTAINEVVLPLQADGLNIKIVDNHSIIDPEVDLFDGTHPNNGGHIKLIKNFQRTEIELLGLPWDDKYLSLIRT